MTNKLLNHNNRTGKLLTRGSKIEVKNKVNREDIKEIIKSAEVPTSPQLRQVTDPKNIRVDNHIRNDIMAFVTLGKFDSNKEFCETMVERFKETLTADEIKRFNYLKETYELKDYERAQRKKRN